jgi:hypothetical protein
LSFHRDFQVAIDSLSITIAKASFNFMAFTIV